MRNLLVPSGALKSIQKQIKEVILDEVPWPVCVYGGVRRRSTKANAAVHVGQPVIFTLDIKSFFPSVRPGRVVQAFEGIGFGEPAAKLLARLTTFDNQLPQGTHTSTALANLVLSRADFRITRLANEHGFTYTRYVDDLSLSGGGRLYKFRNLIVRIIEDEGFQIKIEKKHTESSRVRQIVTKLVVNTKVNLTREKRQEIRRAVLSEAHQTNGVLSPRGKGLLAWLSYINPKAGAKVKNRIGSLGTA